MTATLEIMTAREKLMRVVLDLSDEEVDAALLMTERHRGDAMLQALTAAPVDDEPTTPEEDRSAEEALASYRGGEAIGPDELKRELGIA